jgi:hypothetical protein
MFKNFFLSFVLATIIASSLFGSVRVKAQDAGSGVIGFSQCNFSTSTTSKSLTPCIQQVMTFLFVIGIFLMAFRIAYIGLNRFNPLDNSEGQEVGLVRDTMIGLILLGAPALILGSLNTGLLDLNILDFSRFTGGAKIQEPVVTKKNISAGTIGNVVTGTTRPVSNTATAKPVITNGKLVSAVVNSAGKGYKSKPKINIISETGTGATAEGIVFGDVLTGIKIIDEGTNYGPDTVFEIVGGGEEDPFKINLSPVLKVVGVSAVELEGAFKALSNSNIDTGAITKVLRAERNCDYQVFSFNSLSQADCDNLKSEEFATVFATYSTQLRFLKTNTSNEIATFQGTFTNQEDVTITATGSASTRLPDGYSTATFDNQGPKEFCFRNYFVVKVNSGKYPDRSMSIDECGPIDIGLDGKQFTKYGTGYNSGFAGFGGNAYEFRNPTPEAKAGLSFPAGSTFIRKVKI